MSSAIRQSASLNFFYLGLLAVVGLGVNILIARFGGPAVLGEYVFFLTLAEAVSKVATMGLNITLTQEFVRDSSDTHASHFSFHVDVGYVTLLLGGGVALIFFLFGWTTAALVTLTAVLLATKVILTTGYNFFALSHRLFALEVFQTLVFGLAAIILIHTNHLSATSLFLVFLLAITVTIVTGLAGLRRKTPLDLTPRFRWQRYLTYLRASLYNNLYILLQYLIYRLDVLLIKPLLGTTPLGVYSVATNLTEKTQITTTALATTHFAALIPLLKKRDFSAARALTDRTLVTALALNSLAIVGLVPLAWWLIPIVYGPAYQVAFSLVVYLIPGMVAITVSKILYNHLILRHATRACLVASLIGIAAMSTLLLTFLRVDGIQVAPIASSVTYLVVAGLLYRSYRLLEKES